MPAALRPLALAGLLPLCAPAAHAQQALGADMGLQVRLNAPTENLKDAVGNRMGYGLSLSVESDLEDGWAIRTALGADRWGEGDWTGRKDVKATVTVSHLTVEVVKMLRADTEPYLLGPYVFLGVGGYGWSVAETSPSLGYKLTRRVLHAGGSAGIGYRFSPRWDLEVRLTMGRVHPDYMLLGGSLSVGGTFRF